MYMTGFQCLRCGHGSESLGEDMACGVCGGNLEVVYAYDMLRDLAEAGRLWTSGRRDVFRYLPLLPVRDVSLASPLRVGCTPLYEANRLGERAGLRGVMIKDDGMNPTSSFKDRAGAIALVRARETGARVIAGASTGNAGSSIAGLCASVGQACVVFVPESAPPAKLLQLRAYGAAVIAVRGTYDDAYDLCTKTCKAYGWFNRNTGANPFTREGKKTCSFEIWEQLGGVAPDRVVVPVGDGNIISGIWKGFRDLLRVGLIDRMPKIDAAQAAGSAAVTRTVERLRSEGGALTTMDWRSVEVETVSAKTLADSISVDAPRDGLAAVRAVLETGGEAVAVADEAILDAERELASVAGIFTEPASATAWAGIKALAASGRLDPDERMVCLLTGNGLKDAGKIAGRLPELPVIDPEVTAVERVLEGSGLLEG
ncbi:MAG TPA: threonine synthase [Kiritimatiellia bacterium]|mgnify:CR=1 FL=1|nr:threonine synthase [Kiritimatiellia bacterium]